MVKGYAPLAAHNKPHVAQGTCAETQRQASPCCEAGVARGEPISDSAGFILHARIDEMHANPFQFSLQPFLVG
jgi:hypothetical protein